MKKILLLLVLVAFLPVDAFAGWASYKTVRWYKPGIRHTSPYYITQVQPYGPVDKAGLDSVICPTVTYTVDATGAQETYTYQGGGDSDGACFDTAAYPMGYYYQLETSASYSMGMLTVTLKRSYCGLPPTGSNPFYGPDGMACLDNQLDPGACSTEEITYPSAQPCCTNGVKDGMEFATDQGGACSTLPTTCAEGGNEITVGGITFCGVPRAESTQAECESNGAFWTGGACYFNAGAPVYAGPDPNDQGLNSPDGLEAQNKTNQILKDMVNSSTRDAANIVAAINTNTDVSNKAASSIVSAIANNQSAIVAAINSKNFSPTITVEAPSVTVEAPAVNIDTSSITNAVQVNGGKLDQTNGKLDQTLGKLDTQTGIFNGISATLDQHLATAQAARDEAAAASGQAIIRADATNGKLDQTNGKLDTANGELNGIKTTLDQHLAVATAARDAASDSKTLLTNIKDGQDSVKLAVDGVKAAIEANGPGGTGTATDMTATNAKLDEIKGLLGSGNPQASQPTAPAGFGERFTGLQDTVIARWDLMKERVLASGAFGSLQQLLGAIPNGGGSTAISINAGRFGDIAYDFGNLGQALAVLALIFKAIFSVLAIRIILLKGG